MPERETRFAELQSFKIEQRAEADAAEAGNMIIEGYAVVFESETEIGNARNGGFYEIIDRNAFNGCNMRDVPLRYNHSEAVPILARTRNKSLQLSIDSKGLKIRAELLDTQDARDMYARIKNGLIDSMSFAFTVAPDGEQITSRNGAPVRRITKFERLFDCSVVDIPAYDATSVYARSFELADGWRAAEKKKEAEAKEKEERKEAAELKAVLVRWAK